MKKQSLIIILGLFGLLYCSLMGSVFGVSEPTLCELQNQTTPPKIYITSPTSNFVSGNTVELEWTYYNSTTTPPSAGCVINYSFYIPNGDQEVFLENTSVSELPTSYTYDVPSGITNGSLLSFRFILVYPVVNDTVTYIRDINLQWIEGGSTSNIWIWLIIIGLGIGIAVGIYVYYKNKQPEYPISPYGAYPPSYSSYPMAFPPQQSLPQQSLQSPQSKVLSPQCQSQDKLLNDPFCIDEFIKLYGKTPQEQFGIKKQLKKI